ncbi:GHKL domain-containing protein [Paenibacillus sp. PR3]|uniref:GHKL domain-containing protein n=1 Tax=Paenibacillus terricola TaxID=2763503 RepID=A0ABR8MY64_9BACL|nr:GHKL domain-containing protein [Paenibacillus terricola]MBD3920876.1 GHKL domain-containing protein [Paenibacillus terricola]
MIIFISILIQVTMMVVSARLLLGQRLGWDTLLLMLLGGQAIGYFSYNWLGPIGVFAVLGWLAALIIKRLRKPVIGAIVPILAQIINVISDYIVNTFYIVVLHKDPVTNGDTWETPFYNGLSLVVSLLLALSFSYLFRIFITHEMPIKRYGLLFTVLSALTLIIFYVNILIGKQQGFTDDNIRANSILFFFYFILLIVVCIVLVRIMMKEADIQNKQVQYDRLTEYTDNLEQLYIDMQKFRHDYINILLTMSDYIRSGDAERLERYFNERIMPISQGMQSNNYKLGALHNVRLQELKGILSSKLIKAQELKIDAVIEVVETIEQVNMDSVQLCRCLGILLDNAIEEAVHCETPTVRAAVIKRDQSVLIAVTNSCRSNTPELHRIFERGFSTKGTNRGLGLSNLKEIVSRTESATLDTQIVNGEFIQLLEVFNGPITKSRMTG